MKELPCWTGTARCQKLLEQEIRKLQWKGFTDAERTFARLRASRVCFSSHLSLTDSEGGGVSNTLRLAAD